MTLDSCRALFVICLVITIISAVVTVIFFFVFDMRKIISMKTGFAVKRGMKQLVDDMAKTDELLPDIRRKSEQIMEKTVLLEETARLDIPAGREKKRLDMDEFFEITESKTVIQKEGVGL